MIKKIGIAFGLLIVCVGQVQAQAYLSAQEAIDVALAQNYGIRAAQLQAQAAKIQVFKGNAGMLPRVDLNANFGGGLTNINQKLSNGTEINRSAQTLTPSSNVALSWVVFDGKRMFATYDRLKKEDQLGQIQAKRTMEATVAAVMDTYYRIIFQKQSVRFLKTIIGYYEERLKITEQRWQFGKGSKIDFLLSQNDYNAQIAQLNAAETALLNAKVALNELLARPLEQPFEVADSLTLDYFPTLDDLLSEARVYNKDIQEVKKRMDINRDVEREAEALRLPRITLNSAYGYTMNRSNAGLFLLNQNFGLTSSLGATWNIFNGELIRRQVQTAKINSEVLLQQQKDLQNRLESAITQAYNQLMLDRKQLKLEEDTYAIANESFQIALQKFRLGGSTILDIIEAQRNFDTSLNRLVAARFNIKLSELNLQLLSGEIVK